LKFSLPKILQLVLPNNRTSFIYAGNNKFAGFISTTGSIFCTRNYTADEDLQFLPCTNSLSCLKEKTRTLFAGTS
jgi:hypothetical protein